MGGWEGARAPAGRAARKGVRRLLAGLLLVISVAGLSSAAGRDAPLFPDPFVPPPAPVGGQLLAEGFEDAAFPPAGWSYSPVAPAPHRWLPTTDPANVYAGGRAAFVQWSDDVWPDENLVTPSLDLGAAPPDVALSFAWRTDPFWYEQDVNALAVHLSTDGGGSWERIFWVHQVAETGWAWRTTVVDLSAWVGQPDVRIRFRYWGYGGADCALDEIRVGAPIAGPPANDDCAGAAAGGFRIGPDPGTVVVSGSTEGAAADYPLSAAGCTGFVQSAPDVVWIVEVPAGHRVHAVMDAAGDWDDTLFLVDDCANPEGTCLDGDRAFPDGSTVTWTNDGAAPREVKLIATGHGTEAGDLAITATIEPAVGLSSTGWGRVKSLYRGGRP
jgi:hypothetical protein